MYYALTRYLFANEYSVFHFSKILLPNLVLSEFVCASANYVTAFFLQLFCNLVHMYRVEKENFYNNNRTILRYFLSCCRKI